jgi:mRNA-degrading endonuclease RelE of RelBE toxin-antitoxin system
MPFWVQIMPSALTELQAIKVFNRRQIAQAIDDQLAQQPLVETKNRKPMKDPRPTFECELPLWELRVGTFRVFYDVDESAQTVSVRAIREKPPHAKTEEVL